MTELKDLIGKHKLSGFDTSIPDLIINLGYRIKKRYDDGICFIIDGVKYQIYCDLDDGYRSYLSDLYMNESVACRNTFEPEDVFIVDAKTLNREYEGIIIYSMDGKIVASLYTDYEDDWYPYARSEWNPDNLMVNRKNGWYTII